MHQQWTFFLLATLHLSHAGKIIKNRLSDSILHYEPLLYDTGELIANHFRARRSLHPHLGEQELHLNFNAHQRMFNLRLKRDSSLFADGLQMDEGTDFHPNNIYEGRLLGEPLSFVHGFVFDGIFEGRVHTQDGKEFHIESAKPYKLENDSIHSIMYDTDDISYKLPHQCGGLLARTRYNLEKNTSLWSNANNDKVMFEPEVQYNHYNSRHRREVTPQTTRKTECHLYVRADPTYKNHAGSDARATYMMSQHVKRVSRIFSQTDFDTDPAVPQAGYTLNIKRIGVINADNCKPGDTTTQCRYNSNNIGVEKFLDIASLEDHSQYCLSYVFAHRDFSEGVLGLAWIGDIGGAGGICDPYQSIQGSMKSLNTGIVSNLNYGKSVPSKVTDITLAHELGHNFGSPHDPIAGPNKGKCAPGGAQGNYIMYPRATSGTEGNNNKFSVCSRDSIKKVLDAKADICFKKSGEPICGNRVKEGNEECDCGYKEEDSCKVEDPCCNGAEHSGSGTGSGCKLSPKAKAVLNNLGCSPSMDFCCDKTQCAPFTDNRVCFEATDCAETARCNANSYKCPDAATKPDNKTTCNGGSNTCVKGECSGSLCLIEDMKDCQCPKQEDFCKICCQEKTSSGTSNCTVYQDKTKPDGERHVQRPPGSPCDQYQGYCDILDKCRKVDAEGPLSRLKKWLFNPKSFDTILDWMRTHWWACVLIALGLILFMAGFIACCSVHTPSSNPAKPQHRTLRQTLSRRSRSRPTAPPTSSNGGGGGRSTYPDHPPGYSTAVRESRILPEYEMSNSYNYR